MPQEYHIRIDLDRDDKKVIDFFRNYGALEYNRKKVVIKDYVITYEVSSSGKSHYHVYAVTDQVRTTLHGHVSRYFGVFGSCFSVSKKRTDNLLSYILKDGMLIESNIATSILEDARASSYKKKDLKKPTSFFHKLKDIILEEEILDKRDIGKRILLEYANKVRITPSDFQLKGMIDTLYHIQLQNHSKMNDLNRSFDRILDRVLYD